MTDHALHDENARRLSRLTRATVIVAALGLTGTMASCADIHPAGDDTGGGMLSSPNDEAEDDRRIADEEAEHGREAEEHQNR